MAERCVFYLGVLGCSGAMHPRVPFAQLPGEPVELAIKNGSFGEQLEIRAWRFMSVNSIVSLIEP